MAVTRREDEHPTERALRLMREEWEAPLRAEVERLHGDVAFMRGEARDWHERYGKAQDEIVLRDLTIRRLQEALRQVNDYCAGMLAALDAEPYASDLPTLGEALRDIQERAS
jgi:hypothetical protein